MAAICAPATQIWPKKEFVRPAVKSEQIAKNPPPASHKIRFRIFHFNQFKGKSVIEKSIPEPTHVFSLAISDRGFKEYDRLCNNLTGVAKSFLYLYQQPIWKIVLEANQLILDNFEKENQKINRARKKNNNRHH